MNMYHHDEFEILLQGDYTKGYDAYFSKSFGNYLPGEPEDVTDFKVYLVKLDEQNKEQLLDITDWLSPRKKDRLMTDFMEHCRETSLEKEYDRD